LSWSASCPPFSLFPFLLSLRNSDVACDMQGN
jgi:hypothetical protein